jgi:hypothetical protein
MDQLRADEIMDLIAAGVRRGARIGLKRGLEIAKENIEVEFTAPNSVEYRWGKAEAELKEELGEIAL